MVDIPVNFALIKASLLKDLRVGVFFKHEETTVEYHFIRDPRSLPGILESVVCVMYTSTTSDPLRLSGVSQPIKVFMNIFEKQEMYSGYTPYKRVGLKLYPGDWYPCFETDKEGRISQVKGVLPELQSLAEKIGTDDRKQEREQKQMDEDRRRQREQRELEYKRIEADQARWNRFIRVIPQVKVANGQILIPDDVTDDDISNMLAEGFFGI